jgi:carbamoylphosphate synthase small subunit
MIGNYGVPRSKLDNDTDLSTGLESGSIQVAGLIVQDYSNSYSHWNANQSLSQWLKDEVCLKTDKEEKKKFSVCNQKN